MQNLFIYCAKLWPFLSLSGLSTFLIFSGAAVELTEQMLERDKQEIIVYFEKQRDCEIRQACHKENKLNIARIVKLS